MSRCSGFGWSALAAFLLFFGVSPAMATVRFPQYSLQLLSDRATVDGEISRYESMRGEIESRLTGANQVLAVTLGDDLKRVDVILEALRYVRQNGARPDDPELLKLPFFRKAVVQGLEKVALPAPEARRAARLSTSSGRGAANLGVDEGLPQPGEGTPGEKPRPAARKGEISFGEEVDLKDYVVAGQMTIFDFFSEFCGPCRQVSPLLTQLDQQREDITVVKVNINRPEIRGIDWESPVARQYRLQSVPYFVVYNSKGNIEAEGKEAFALVSLILFQQGIK